jgi:UDP-glucose 4-epimerase
MRILVTGGAGFVGSHLVERLVDVGHKVDVIDDLSNGRKDNLKTVRRQIRFHENDVSLSLVKHLSRTKFDAIYHLPCFPRSRSFEEPKRDVEVNVIGMVNVLELAKKDKPKIIFSSNSGIYDTSKMPIDESTRDDPKTPYDLDKLQAEKYLKLYRDTFGIEHVIFRFATVYGPRQSLSDKWKPVVLEFINSLSKRQRPVIHWDGEQTRDFIYVADIVNALVMALENKNANGETMILGSGRETSINELYRVVSRLVGANIEPLCEPKKLGDIRRMRYNCEKAERILGWKAVTTLEEGVEKTVAFQKDRTVRNGLPESRPH